MADFEPVVGRYLSVDIAEQRCRVFVEQVGAGPPLLCLHTAGADSRQYRHLMADPEVTGRWQVTAFDLPWHGRSTPPAGWWESDYLLSTDWYATAVMAVARALELSSPVVLGCSMGGTLALELARLHPDEIRGVVALEAASHIEGRFVDCSVWPCVDGSVFAATWTYGLMAPFGPEEDRRENWWIYSQGGPGVYRGDTWFYSEDWDLRGRETEIDTTRCPVYLMTGEYDAACTPAESEATAAAIPGARSVTMTRLGHFPMIENYQAFRHHLLPVLDELAAM